ncbi:MAG: tetratricopeptide repeat protein [Coprobacter sp.]|nr:tetratricopeptide repeat protein [Coprobacter sp.]
MEFQDALGLIQYTSQSVFLTGKAGTGKSTFLKYVCDTVRKKSIVLAPTGVAAINAGGSTIHSFFKMPFRPILPDDPDLSLTDGRIFDFLKYRKSHRKLLREVELIIIDEISMVRADMMDFIDRVLRVFSGNMRIPFGGKQMLLVGDIFQLEPVVTPDAREILGRFYPNACFFSARVFQEMKLVPIELKKVYRQTDKVFVSMLDKIRTNTVTDADLRLLNTRYHPAYVPEADDFSITLATRRDSVDYINDRQLAALPGPEYEFLGEIHGDFPDSSLPTQKSLILKEKAQVIFIKNDYEKRWVNGTIGMVSAISDTGIYVLLENGEEHLVEKESWQNIRYTYNEEKKCIEEEELGSFVQYPMRLAWAITVHKSQGLTFNHVVVDLSGGAFAGGQTYVALSRCTSLEGIVLKKRISRTDIFVKPEIVAFSRQFNDKKLIEQALKLAQADRLYRDAVRQFDNGDFETFLQTFFEAIHSRYDLEKPLVKRFIRKKLEIINLQQQKIKELENRLADQTRSMKQYAYEYYLLGNECITKARDAKAALANFDKALALDPLLLDAWVRKGVTLMDRGDVYEAAVCLNEAVRLSPRYFKALYNRGKLRYKIKDYEAAVSDLQKASDLKPDNPTVHDRLGDAYSKMGDMEQAAIQWAIAEKIREQKSK